MIALGNDHKECVSIAKIKVIGIGGAGGNTVNSIIETGAHDFDCIVANTDLQALELSKADTKLQIGIKSTKGLGTGANPEIGQRAAEEDLDKILQAIDDADIVFLAAGMGGGTGSGGAPVVARALREKGILTIAIVTKPFLFEGKRRAAVAEKALEQLRKEVDTLLIIPNQKLLELVDQRVSMIHAFGMINDVLCQSVRGISDIITKPGHINVDFADVRTIMRDRGVAIMGTGKASGDGRARKAAENAIASPLLENVSIKGAHGVLLNITGGKNLGIHEISDAASVVYEQAHQDANIIIGSVIDESLQDEVVVTIIATGCSAPASVQAQAPIKAAPEIIIPAQHMPVTEPAVETATMCAEATERQEQTMHTAVSGVAHVLRNSESEAGSAKTGASEIDINDLDVPSFLRKQAREESVHE